MSYNNQSIKMWVCAQDIKVNHGSGMNGMPKLLYTSNFQEVNLRIYIFQAGKSTFIDFKIFFFLHETIIARISMF